MIDINRFIKHHKQDDMVSVRQFIAIHVNDNAYEKYASFVDKTGKCETEVRLFEGTRTGTDQEVYAFIVGLEGMDDELHFMVEEADMKITFKDSGEKA